MLPEERRLPTKQEFETAIERAFNLYKTYIQEAYDEKPHLSWRDWIEVAGSDEVVRTLENEGPLAQKYWNFLPEDVNVYDVMDLYQKGELPTYRPAPSFQNIQIEPTDGIQRTRFWQPSEVPAYTSRKIKSLYELARRKVTTSNKSAILQARKELLFTFNRSPNIAKDSGIEAKNLNSWIRSFSGMSVKDRQQEYQLNQGVPEEHQWMGFSNSSWINRITIDPNELDQFVGDIDVPNETEMPWRGQSGDTLRRYIVSTFLSIDTRILYDDLNFMIGDCEKRSNRGQYFNNKSTLHGKEIKPKTVVISQLFKNTVAHEIGHYLDYKWAAQYGFSSTPLSTGGFNYPIMPEGHKEWMKKFDQFMNQIEDKADIHSEYTQRRSEVFARFIDKFCQWASREQHGHDYSQYFDKFDQNDFRLFVRLLQEKSFIDAKFPMSLKLSSRKNWIQKIC